MIDMMAKQQRYNQQNEQHCYQSDNEMIKKNPGIFGIKTE